LTPASFFAAVSFDAFASDGFDDGGGLYGPLTVTTFAAWRQFASHAWGGGRTVALDTPRAIARGLSGRRRATRCGDQIGRALAENERLRARARGRVLSTVDECLPMKSFFTGQFDPRLIGRLKNKSSRGDSFSREF